MQILTGVRAALSSAYPLLFLVFFPLSYSFSPPSQNNPLKKSYPFILLTNGGGTLESDRAKKLTKELGVPIAESSLVLSHTVFRSLVPKYGDKPVLVIGGNDDSCRRVAEAYVVLLFSSLTSH